VASLLIASAIELLGFGQPSTLPQCTGAIFQLAPGYDFSAPQPVTDIVGELILDGERPFGRRASNRTMTLPIVITVPATGDDLADQATLTAARETLLQTIDAQTWTLTWTSDSGLPLVFDCFRALPTVVSYSVRHDRSLVSQVTISFQALPYGRSDAPQRLAFDSPVTGGGIPPPPASPVTLTDFETVSGTGWTASTVHITGSHSAYWNGFDDPTTFNGQNGEVITYHATFSSKNLTGLTSLQMWIGFSSEQAWDYWGSGPVTPTVTFTLKDSAGRAVSFGTTVSSTVGRLDLTPTWNQVTAALPGSIGSFNLAAVVACDIKVSHYSGFWLNVFLDDLTAQPVTTGAAASARGSLYTLHSVVGTSHAPLNLTFQQSGATAFKTLVAHRPGPDSPLNLTPFVSTTSVTDPPDGREYAVTSQVSGQNARFSGTYTVVAVANSWASSGSPRTLTITLHQYEYTSGPSSTQSVSRTFTPSTDIVNGIAVIGELTLPGKDIAADNTDAYFTLGITDTNSSDRFLDVLLLDTQGQTVIINEASTSYVTYYLDEPTPDRDLGRVLGSATDRTQAVSVLDSAFVSGGPLTVDGGTDCVLFAYAVEGAPAIGANYYPRWFVDRLA